jgi:primosomal replication protein N''
MTYVRLCPRCKTARPAEEFVCEGTFHGTPCRWDLFNEIPIPEGSEAAPTGPSASPTRAQERTSSEASHCRNGHPLEPGDFMCMVCGEPATASAQPAPPSGPVDAARVANGWVLGALLEATAEGADLYLAHKTSSKDDSRDEAVFKHYRRGIEPEPAHYPALRTLDPAHGQRLLDAGRFEDRAYEVWEYLPLGSLGMLPLEEKTDPEFARQVVRELAAALHGLAEVQLIHRDLKPANVLIRSREPLDLVLSDFSTATISEFDLQPTLARQATRYAAPETIVGTCSAASDWWSLGVIVLELLTRGRGVQGVHERAFLLQLITRGVPVPKELPEEWRELLMGLLTRDAVRRWGWDEVRRWLGGERGIPTAYAQEQGDEAAGARALRLGDKAWANPASFALAAAESAHWEEAREILRSGRLATWLQERGGERDAVHAAHLRNITADLDLPDDARLALALLLLNDNLPLCRSGEIITPAWVLAHPEVATAWLESAVPAWLRKLGRETWLVRLRERADRVRARVREFQIPSDEAQLSAALLATSRGALERKWHDLRRRLPEAEHPALAGACERRVPSEEDLLLLVSAPLDAFRTAEEVLDEAAREAARAGVAFDREAGQAWLDRGRRVAIDEVSERVRNFTRCGRELPDQWADDFRQDHRITLARALVLLAIERSEWREPPRQEYVRNVLEFFHRRLVTGLQRGGLVRMTIGRTTARLDLTELGAPARSAGELLAAILARQTQPVAVDPAALLADPLRENRLRRLVQNSAAYRRDTGINALYVGFPFVVLRDPRASEATKPRIAPALLWPVRLDMPGGARATVRLSFDAEREEVRINPALEGLLGGQAPAWREALDSIRGREHLDLQAALDSLIPLAPLAKSASEPPVTLRPLPPATVKIAAAHLELHPCAVLFHSDFSGQTIAENLKQLAHTPIQGTALEVAIRAGVAAAAEPDAAPAELDRYFTAASDPSQQSAVFRARQAPGLVVQGPPGTGKSQTIVNIVCDALGRGERVLIVCQKLAALEVVRKRLEAEGLGERLFFLKDTVSDRRPALMELRAQLEDPARTQTAEGALRREREGLARHIETLEAEINQAHTAMFDAPPEAPGGLPYREILNGLIEVEQGARPPVALARLASVLGPLDRSEAEQAIAELAPLAPLWREAKFEESPLQKLAYFRTDEATVGEFKAALAAFQMAEDRRHGVLRKHARFFSVEAPEELQRWLGEHETTLRALPANVARSLSRWAGHFTPPAEGSPAPAEQLLPWLAHLEEQLRVLDQWTLHPSLYAQLAVRGAAPLRDLAQSTRQLAEPPASFLARVSPLRWLARRRLDRWLRAGGADPEAVDLPTLSAAAELELAFRPERASLQEWLRSLGEEAAAQQSLPELRSTLRRLIENLQLVLAAARRVQACPMPDAAAELRESGDPTAYASILDHCRASLELWSATRESSASLDTVAGWFTPEWAAARRGALEQHSAATDSLEEIAAAVPALAPFQTFRVRARALAPTTLRLFALLRERNDLWSGLSPADLIAEVSRTLRREALLAWKDAAEQACPALLMERAEHEGKVKLLGERDEAIREANRRLLSKCAATTPLARRSEWDDVVMLQGQRARKLREVVDRGGPLGLFHLRPVWMVNPEVASRLFPLQAGLFDLVIFDEASQLPVEATLPALFRAKRVVVSGDEKQMPPSRYFGSQLDSDEEESSDEWLDADDDRLDDAQRERLAQASGRREVKDCGDLLTLTQNLLPTATLKIHYRSKYRQLIDYSNAAFYGGRLNVPARHPAEKVRQAQPLEVDRVDGRYGEQTNPAEAARVVARLRELWRRPPEERPSLGVVTFNLKQADLIQDQLEALAEEDGEFRQAWEVEQSRTQRGEDMGFFVKNLENVQGDERDWIFFSTTFGRDAAGVFRRNFGVLGQHGGERRLNVAVTRAREKVVVVTSMPTNEISAWITNHGRRPPSIPRDFLQGWLAWAERLHTGNLDTAGDLLEHLNSAEATAVRSTPADAPASPFIREVAGFIRALGHEPVPASGDAFGVDFALVDERTGLFSLGIECDAPTHPLLQTVRARELWRPWILSASIPRLHRVSSRAWYHQRGEEQERLRAAVQSAFS